MITAARQLATWLYDMPSGRYRIARFGGTEPWFGVSNEYGGGCAKTIAQLLIDKLVRDGWIEFGPYGSPKVTTRGSLELRRLAYAQYFPELKAELS